MSFARGGRRCTRAALVWLTAVSSPSLLSSQQAEPPIIPRGVLFGNPDRVFPQVSPDGRMLAYLAPDSGVLNVWVRTIGRRDDRPVTNDRTRPIFQYYWQGDSKHVLHLQDRGGDENWRLFQTDVATGKTRDFTPNDSVQTQIIAVDPGFPSEILVAWNMRDRRYHDAYRLHLTTGRRTLVATNPGDVGGWLADTRLQVRAASATLPDGGTELRTRSGNAAEWRAVRRESPDETFPTAAGFTPDNRGLWLLSSVGANAARLLRMDAASGATSSLAEDSVFDATGILVHPTSHALQAVQFTRQRLEWQAIDSAVSADLRTLQGVRDGDFTIDSRDRADRKWIVTYVVSDGPVAYYLYERPTRRATLLFVHRPALERYTLARMEPVAFAARDSLRLYGYLTLPPGKEPKRLPARAAGPRRPVGPRRLGLQPRRPVARQPRLRRAAGQLPRLDRLRQEVSSTPATASGPARCTTTSSTRKAGRSSRACRPEEGRHHGRQLRRLRDAGRADVHARTCSPAAWTSSARRNLVTLLKTIPPYWASAQGDLRQAASATSADGRRVPGGALAALPGRRDPAAAADRPGGQRPAREAGRERPDRRGDARGTARRCSTCCSRTRATASRGRRTGCSFFAAAEQFLAEHLGGRAEPAAAEEKVEPFVQ